MTDPVLGHQRVGNGWIVPRMAMRGRIDSIACFLVRVLKLGLLHVAQARATRAWSHGRSWLRSQFLSQPSSNPVKAVVETAGRSRKMAPGASWLANEPPSASELGVNMLRLLALACRSMHVQDEQERSWVMQNITK